jgi:hypothetical protein
MTDTSSSGPGTKSSVSGALRAASSEVKEKLAESASNASEIATEKQAAEDIATHATDRIQEEMGKRKNVGADFAARFAENIREAAKSFEVDTPIAGRAVLSAADYIDQAARKFRDGSVSDVVDEMTTFARRQPLAFLGLSALAGFAVVRFLKASSTPGAGSTGPSSYGEMNQSASLRQG